MNVAPHPRFINASIAAKTAGSHSTSAAGPHSPSAASRLLAATLSAYSLRLGASRCAAKDARSDALRTSHTDVATDRTHRSLSEGHGDTRGRRSESESESVSEFDESDAAMSSQLSSAHVTSAAVEYIASNLAVTSSTDPVSIDSKLRSKGLLGAVVSSSFSAPRVKILSRGGLAIRCSANECFSPTNTPMHRLIPSTLNGESVSGDTPSHAYTSPNAVTAAHRVFPAAIDTHSPGMSSTNDVRSPGSSLLHRSTAPSDVSARDVAAPAATATTHPPPRHVLDVTPWWSVKTSSRRTRPETRSTRRGDQDPCPHWNTPSSAVSATV